MISSRKLSLGISYFGSLPNVFLGQISMLIIKNNQILENFWKQYIEICQKIIKSVSKIKKK